MTDSTLTASPRHRDIPEVPMANVSYDAPATLASGYVIVVPPEDDR